LTPRPAVRSGKQWRDSPVWRHDRSPVLKVVGGSRPERRQPLPAFRRHGGNGVDQMTFDVAMESKYFLIDFSEPVAQGVGVERLGPQGVLIPTSLMFDPLLL